jgi:hypothetical protein
MMRFALIAALLAGRCAAAPALTTIQDVLYKADGARFEGVAQIEWKSFQAADGSEIPQQTLSVRVTAGNLRVALVPTSNATKPLTYTVKFNSDGRTQFVEYWSVAPSTIPLRLKDVRTQPAAGNITSGSAVITDITGLRAELDARPIKGDAYVLSRTAIINGSGALDGALGNASDCVHVDGTSGPCGSSAPLFVDAETPGGVINGVNTTLTLSAAPSPASSLKLYRNGLLLRDGIGFTVSGSSITMLPGSVPVAGDVLQAWYRLPTNATLTLQFYENETPAGAVDGSNSAFTLQATPMPASSLQISRNGILLKAGLDYILNVNGITFMAGAIPQPGDVLQAFYRR